MAREYLRLALEDGPDEFLAALGNVVRARNVSQIAKDTGTNRRSLYRSLAPDANPAFRTIFAVLNEIGFDISLVVKRPEQEEQHLIAAG